MIQRKQTLFLLLALLCTVVCMMIPVGSFEPEGMGPLAVMYNLYVKGEGEAPAVFPLFILLLLTCPVALWAIFKYTNRKFQAKLCIIALLLDIVWVILYLVYGFVIGMNHTTFHVAPACGLPVLSSIFYLLAYQGIMDDERLVRAANRIR